MANVLITDHARFEIARRHISEEVVLSVARNPQQVQSSSEGRFVYQSKYHDAEASGEMLLRVVVEHQETALVIVTAYKTSQIEKYWQPEGIT